MERPLSATPREAEEEDVRAITEDSAALGVAPLLGPGSLGSHAGGRKLLQPLSSKTVGRAAAVASDGSSANTKEVGEERGHKGEGEGTVESTRTPSTKMPSALAELASIRMQAAAFGDDGLERDELHSSDEEEGEVYEKKEDPNAEPDVQLKFDISAKLKESGRITRGYVWAFSYFIYICFNCALLMLQSDVPRSFQVFRTLQNALKFGEGSNSGVPASLDDVPTWLNASVLSKTFSDPVCGDGKCTAPYEYAAFAEAGCLADCGLEAGSKRGILWGLFLLCVSFPVPSACLPPPFGALFGIGFGVTPEKQLYTLNQKPLNPPS
jgi:hypothetical protein